MAQLHSQICLPTPPSWGLPSRLRHRLCCSQLLQILGLALFLTLGTLVILICPPMVFSHVEGWSFGEGFYFAFITLSTIGFGDYVVGENKAVTYLRAGATGIGGMGRCQQEVSSENQMIVPGSLRATNGL